MKRRAFLKAAVAAIQSGIALVVAVPGVRYLLGPLRGRAKEAGFLRVIPLSALPEGRPFRVVVSADRYDAYTHHPPGPIGSVWLVRERGERTGATGSGNVSPTSKARGHARMWDRLSSRSDDRLESLSHILCLQTICPHLGCGIDFVEDRGAFSCPCHTSEFDGSGKWVSGPAPRDMDELVCRVTDPDEDGQRWVEVRYQEFRTGIADRSSIADRGSTRRNVES